MNSRDTAQAMACLDKMRLEALEISRRYEKSTTPDDGARFLMAFGAFVDLKNAIRGVKNAAKALRELQKAA